MKINESIIGIIGLGYVGLPLALAFSKKYPVIGFDVNQSRINELIDHKDYTNEIETEKLISATSGNLSLTFNPYNLKDCNVFIITVPTPLNPDNTPDLNPLKSASCIVGKSLKEGSVVIYESTVYPGCTEEICVPILEQFSNLKLNKGFYCGYSPERINPGDHSRPIETITKVTSGSSKRASQFVDNLYKTIITGGTHKASSIKVAEASKIIENAQRDLNISFMNEISIICEKLNIDTKEVIEAASTKWNFIKLFPGLVGGHCISVDPYYLTYKSETLGYIPEVIHSGRRINEQMPLFIAGKFIKMALQKKVNIFNGPILILGFTFKENCNDYRNTKVYELIKALRDYNLEVLVYDPLIDQEKVQKQFQVQLLSEVNQIFKKDFIGVILAVPHKEFLSIDFRLFYSKQEIFFDLKGVLDKNESHYRL